VTGFSARVDVVFLLVSGIGATAGPPGLLGLSGVTGKPGVTGGDGCCAHAIAGQEVVAAARIRCRTHLANTTTSICHDPSSRDRNPAGKAHVSLQAHCRRPLWKELFMTLPLFTPIARSLAIASLAGAALVAGSLGPAWAQTGGSGKPPAAAAATSSKPQTVEQRITDLKAALKITPDQEPKWKAVADAMRQNAGAMDKLVQDKRAKAASMTAVDDLETYQDFTKAHLDGLKNLTSAFKSLYDSMPADQKKNADQVFQAFGPSTKSPNQG
jgi:protein CpxP